jgi:transcriptional regulator with XRE-family HTH domain
VSESTISNWRKGKTDPSAENALRLRQFVAEHRYVLTNAL